MKELAQKHRFRCERDACGDYNILGRRGRIFRYSRGKIGVEVYGTAKLFNKIRGMWGEPEQDGDTEAVWVRPETDLTLGAGLIAVARKRKGPTTLPDSFKAAQFKPGHGAQETLRGVK